MSFSTLTLVKITYSQRQKKKKKKAVLGCRKIFVELNAVFLSDSSETVLCLILNYLVTEKITSLRKKPALEVI